MSLKTYHDKFENLSANKQVNEGLYKQAAKILSHRSGTEYEDIAMLDARTGKLLVENNSASGEMKHKCGLTREQHEKLQSSGKQFEILHNHPSSSIPSTADIIGLFNRENAVASTVVCHDGTVYRMEKLKQFDDIDIFIRKIYSDVRFEYYNHSKNAFENKVVEVSIEFLKRAEFLEYRRVS